MLLSLIFISFLQPFQPSLYPTLPKNIPNSAGLYFLFFTNLLSKSSFSGITSFIISFLSSFLALVSSSSINAISNPNSPELYLKCIQNSSINLFSQFCLVIVILAQPHLAKEHLNVILSLPRFGNYSCNPQNPEC